MKSELLVESRGNNQQILAKHIFRLWLLTISKKYRPKKRKNILKILQLYTRFSTSLVIHFNYKFLPDN